MVSSNLVLRYAVLACLPLLALPALAATVQVRVTDASGKPLPDAVVYLDSPEARAAARPAGLTHIEQVNKQFLPAVTVVPAGTRVGFPNRDTFRHHVYSFSPPKKFELQLYAGTEASPVLFDKPGVVVLGCNIHDNMVAWVVVVDTPYYGSTRAGGALDIADVPAGSYRMRVWHAGLPAEAPPLEVPVTVGAAAGPPVTVRLSGVRP